MIPFIYGALNDKSYDIVVVGVGETGLTLVEIQHNGSKGDSLAVTSLISLQNNLIIEIISFNQFLLN